MSRLGLAAPVPAPAAAAPATRSVQRAADSSRAQSRGPQRSMRGVVNDALSSGGEPLEPQTREHMERAYGHSFGNVRIHTGPRASASARALGANAFTVGSDIVFASGRYAPGTSAGKRLLAHELAHVIQQSRGPVGGRSIGDGVSVSEPNDRFEREAVSLASRVASGEIVNPQPAGQGAPALPSRSTVQREAETSARASGGAQSGAASASESMPPMTWAKGPAFGAALELPEDEAAIRVNEALDVMTGLTYVRRPPRASMPIAAAEGPEGGATVAQTDPDLTVQRDLAGSRLAKIHGGVVGSIQVCWDCLTGAASVKGWIWAGIGYDSAFGWFGGFWFREKTWWSGDLGRWFEPGECDPACDPHAAHDDSATGGVGIAGFGEPLKPGERKRFRKASLEVGVLVTPHFTPRGGLCEGDVEIIALLNLLSYLPFGVGPTLTAAVDGLNALTRGTPHFKLEAGIDLSASFHLCKGKDSLLTVNRADFCAGGFVGAGIGLSHTKTENHGAK